MIRTVYVLLLVFLLVAGINAWAQQKAKNKTESKPVKGHAKLLKPTTYLGNSDFSGGVMPKAEFKQMLRKGFSSRDSFGNKYTIVGFDFTYAERNLYEDSVGNDEVLTDYLYEYCPGDTVSSNITNNIYGRIKAGDTVFVEHVKLRILPGNTLLSAADTNLIEGRGMKCVIVK